MATADHLRRLITTTPGLPSREPTASAWQEPPHPSVASWQSSTLPTEVDIVIIGSGVTGCSVASTLLDLPAASGLRITSLEARTAVSGATGRNGGHLVSNAAEIIGARFEHLTLKDMTRIARFSEANISRINEVVAGLSVKDRDAVELRTVISAMALEEKRTFAEMREGIKIFNAIAPPTGHLVHDTLSAEDACKRYNYQPNIAGVAEQHGAGALWPYRLFTAIYAELLKKHGDHFTLETNTPVLSVKYEPSTEVNGHGDDKRKYVVDTPRGLIRCQKVIHCTNGYAAHLIPGLVGKLWPLRGTMSRQKLGPDFANQGSEITWSYFGKTKFDPATEVLDVGLYYAQQNAKTGDLWIGGEVQHIDDLFTSDDSTVGDVARKNLSTVVPKILHHAEPVEVLQMWSGIMAFTADGLPLVGHLPESLTRRQGDGEWFAGGYNGHGMDKGWLCGVAVARMAMGEDAPEFLPASYRLDEARATSISTDVAVNSLLDLFGIVPKTTSIVSLMTVLLPRYCYLLLLRFLANLTARAKHNSL